MCNKSNVQRFPGKKSWLFLFSWYGNECYGGSLSEPLADAAINHDDYLKLFSLKSGRTESMCLDCSNDKFATSSPRKSLGECWHCPR